MKEDTKFCRYYNGEKECPYPTDKGTSVWWNLEKLAIERHEDIQPNTMPPTFCNYIREKHYEPMGHDLTWAECIARAMELYEKGLWSSGYLCYKDTPLHKAY